MKVDVFAHILPEKYLKTYSQKNKAALETFEATNRAVTELDVRFRLMDRHPAPISPLNIEQNSEK